MAKEKHELDQVVEDILQHYGVKGMSWGVRRTEAQLSEAGDGGGGGGGGEEDEEMTEEEKEARKDFPELWKLMDKGKAMAEKLDAMNTKLEKVGDSINKGMDDLKSKGKGILTSIFGKGGDGKFRKAKRNEEATLKLRRQMAKYQKASPEVQARMRKGETKFTVNKTDSRGNRSTKVTTTKKGLLGIPAKSTRSTRTVSTSPTAYKSNGPATRRAYEESKTKPKTDAQKKHDAGKSQFKKDSIAREKKRKENEKNRLRKFTPGR